MVEDTLNVRNSDPHESHYEAFTTWPKGGIVILRQL